MGFPANFIRDSVVSKVKRSTDFFVAVEGVLDLVDTKVKYCLFKLDTRPIVFDRSPISTNESTSSIK